MKIIFQYILFLFTLSLFYIGCSDNPVTTNKKIESPPNPVDTGPWRREASNNTLQLFSVYFTDTSTGYICGAGSPILKTTNGGVNWTPLNSPVRAFTKIKFVNSRLGYVCGMFGTFIKTTDAGQSWLDLPPGTPQYDYNSISFPSSDTGFITGDCGRVLKTTNGGVSWTIQDPDPYNSSFFRTSFINNTTGFLIGRNGTGYKTTNGGLNWLMKLNDLYDDFYDLQFLDANTGLILGGQSLLKTNDAGDNWTIINAGGGSYLHFSSIDTGWSDYADGSISKTKNGGLSWAIIKPVDIYLRSLFFVNNKTGWVVGDSGIILKTTTGGE